MYPNVSPQTLSVHSEDCSTTNMVTKIKGSSCNVLLNDEEMDDGLDIAVSHSHKSHSELFKNKNSKGAFHVLNNYRHEFVRRFSQVQRIFKVNQI